MSRFLPRLCRLSVTTLLTAVIISGCATTQPGDNRALSASEALSLASERDPGTQTQRFLLRAAADLQQSDAHAEARQILRSNLLSNLDGPNDVANQHKLLSLQSAIALQDAAWASELAATLPTSQYQGYPETLQARAARLQLSLYNLAGQPLKTAQLLMELPPAVLELDQQTLNDRIWQALKKTSETDLNKAANSAIGFENQGWYELAATLRQPGLSLEQQGRAIRNWRFNWLGHPGAEPLPSELAIMTQVLEQRPERITLALPLSGPLAAAGNMVREGFLAAYFATRNKPSDGEPTDSQDNSSTVINIADTHGRRFSELLPELLLTKPDLIVGPLAKEDVAELARQEQLPVPILALNYSPNQQPPSSPRLFQFGLSVEDEARQIVQQAIEEGHSQVLVIVPEGEWGDRIATTLKQHAQQLDGLILDLKRYADTDNLRDVSADLLGINTSRQRAIELERTIGLNVEFEPRRRQDAEAIIMVAEPVVARQLKPLFAFYFAGDLPVYSPSIIYSGRPNPSRDRDINGVRFTDLPWILDREPEFRQQAYNEFDNLDGPLGRLFAMGADAWALSTRLPLMQQLNDRTLSGHTGILRLDQNNRVHRTQMWGVFQEGTPVIASDDVTVTDTETQND